MVAEPTEVERLRESILADVHDVIFVLDDRTLGTRQRTADKVDALIAAVLAEPTDQELEDLYMNLDLWPHDPDRGWAKSAIAGYRRLRGAR